MRLGQLARKLALRPTEIVEFLALNHIQIDEGSNTRLEDNQVTLILQQFAPDMAGVIMEEPSDKIENNGVEDGLPLETAMTEPETIPTEIIDEVPLTEDEKVEIIRAAKVSLSGLKVLGKIDLPELKKKEIQPELTKEDSAAIETEKKPHQEVRKNFNQRKKRPDQQRPEKNPVALQREREAKEAQKKRQEQAEREKERRTQNYLKRVKMSPPTKPVKLVKEPVMEMSAQELEEAPKTWLGKFVKWLRT